jgi:2-C-methyl-D-erythritol 2,4-cyclodiphosphate synthase
MKIGFGYDSHRFSFDRPLILGGVRISDNNGLEGHSDGDALSHAITDAVLGAASAQDIGHHFPSSSSQWKDCDSIVLLQESVELVGRLGLKIGNIDATIVCESPRLSQFRQAIIESLVAALKIEPQQVSIKSKTNDNMGWIGSRLGLAVYAITLLEPVE